MKCFAAKMTAILLVAQGLLGAPLDISGFSRHATIQFAGYSGTEVLTNFPVLVKLDTSIPGFSYGHFLSPSGADLRFADVGTNELYYEIDTWNVSGSSYVWVQVPLLTGDGMSIRAYWGKAGMTMPAYTTNGMTWIGAGYLGVWHMNQANVINSASGFAGTSYGTSLTGGPIGSAQFFPLPPNNSKYIAVGNLKVTNYTISAWTRNTYQSNDKTVFQKQSSFFWEQWNIDYNLNQQVYGPSGDQYFQAGNNADLDEPLWSCEVVAYDAATGTGYAYMNGTQANGYPQTQTPMIPTANNNNCTIGANSSTHSYYGSIDEVQLSAVVRSPAWIGANYWNERSPETFAVVALDQGLSCRVNGATDLILSWYGNGALQVAPAPGADAPWSANGLPMPIVTNGMNLVTVSIDGTSAFFRLLLPAKDYVLACNPTNIAVAQGYDAASVISVRKTGGFGNTVTLAISNMPAGVTAYLTPALTNASSLVISADIDADACTGTVFVAGMGGGIGHAVGLNLSVTGAPPFDPYIWPPYNPNLDYSFRDDYPTLTAPTGVLDDVTGVMGTVTSGWWCFRYGANMNPVVSSNAWLPMLQRFNSDFSFFRNYLGWPPDKRGKRGYFSTIYLFGSGLSTDNATSNDLGGWMGSVNYQGENWPMALLSYYPVYSFDPACTYGDRVAQQGGSVHEGIHAVLADMPGCKQAGWFQEGGNTWLQSMLAAYQTSNYTSMGWLSAGTMIAPFMPVECYSGWLQDDSFGGPSAEGVNRYSNSVQLCTWRNLLGGTQYGESFAHFMGEIVSTGSVAWIWQYCTGRVLEGMATAPSGLGEYQTRRLIKEFRGRQVMCDFGKWTPAYKGLLNGTWRSQIHAEYPPIWINCATWTATCYAATSNVGGTLTPEGRTLPGWSGANQIPLTVAASGTVKVYFQPIGSNMSCQLVYRATDGSVLYSRPVSSGICGLRLVKPVRSNVVVAVVCNTDYVYQGEYSRTNKYDYRITFVTNVTDTASIYTKWYN